MGLIFTPAFASAVCIQVQEAFGQVYTCESALGASTRANHGSMHQLFWLLTTLSIYTACMASRLGSMSEAVREEMTKLAQTRPPADDYDMVPLPPTSALPPSPAQLTVHQQVRGTVTSTGRPYIAHVALLDNPLRLSVEPPWRGSCVPRRLTSSTAQACHCAYAINAGFFDINTGECIGSVVSNGRTLQLVESGMVSLGLGQDYWVVGNLKVDTLETLPLYQLVQGIGWLVRDGLPFVSQSIANASSSPFVNEKAPRTAVGILRNGSALLLQVDGQEDIAAGLDLWELSELLLEMGRGQLVQAVNLDGGGSSVTVYEGRVISTPTCVDTAMVCERAVTTIMCVRGERRGEAEEE